MKNTLDDFELLQEVLEIYDQSFVGEYLNKTSPGKWCRETVNRWQKGKASPKLSHKEYKALQSLLPERPSHYDNPEFDFIDLFAGIA
jgi:DNA (cytosine-5)-methyltransferase 1